MRTWHQLRQSIGFTEADEARLRATWPVLAEHIHPIIDRFYERIEGDEVDKHVLEDEAQVARLKVSLRQWLSEMLQGPWDEAYHERRLRIGRVHVRVGLPHASMFMAMNGIRSDLLDLLSEAGERGEAEAAELVATAQAIARITDLELAIMTGTYMRTHEHRELRSLQELIIQNLPVTVLVLDRKGRVTSGTVPPALPVEEGQTLSLTEYLDPLMVAAGDLESQAQHALDADRELTIPRFSVVQDDEERIYRASFVPLQHKHAHVLLHLEELTDVIQAEQRLQQAESLARVGSLSANLAHEIRNPLTAISSTLQVLARSLPEDDRRRPIMEKVQEQVLRMDRLVTDLLGYARPVQSTLERVDARELAREALEQSGVRATLVCQPGTLVLADRQQAVQILVNLLQNARDATAGEGEVVVRCGPGGVIEVVDDGPGVPDEVLDRLFDPFVTTKMRGTGLGLAISRKLARVMGGDLEHLTAEEGRGLGASGACFRLTLTSAGVGVRAS